MNVDIIDSWLLLPLLSIISHFSCQLMCSIRQPLFVNAITPMFIQMYCFRLYFIALYCTVSDRKGMVDIKRYTPLFSLQGDYTVNATITDTITNEEVGCYNVELAIETDCEGLLCILGWYLSTATSTSSPLSCNMLSVAFGGDTLVFGCLFVLFFPPVSN